MEEVIFCVVPKDACIIHAELSNGFILSKESEISVPLDMCEFKGNIGYFSFEGEGENGD